MESKTRIGDICSCICSGGTPRKNVPSFYIHGTIPWLTTSEVNFNRIRSTQGFISQEGLDGSSARWIKPNTIIVAMYGATAGKVAISKIPLTTNQACCNLEIDSRVADYRYVYYWFVNQHSRIASFANGGAQQNLSVKTITDIEIELPRLEIQKSVGNYLSLIDDEIELNSRINGYLLEFLKTKSKSIYGPYEDCLNQLPTGWKRVKVSDVASFVTRGITPKYNAESNQVVLGQTCIRGNLVLPENGRRHCPKKITDKWLRK